MTTQENQTVFAIAWDLEHATFCTVHATKASAIEALNDHAREHWDLDFHGGKDERSGPDAYLIFFEKEAESGQNFYTLDECAVQS